MPESLVGRDAEVIAALAQAGSARGAAKILGVHHASVQRAQRRIAGGSVDTEAPVATVSSLDEIRASERGENGYDPVIPGFAIKQISSQDGDAWIKQTKAPGEVFEVPDGQVVAARVAQGCPTWRCSWRPLASCWMPGPTGRLKTTG